MSTPAQLTRRYEISSGLLYHWKDQYAKGRFDNEPSKEAALEDRVHQLEQLVGKLTLETSFLKKPFIIEHRHLLKSAERQRILSSIKERFRG